MNHSITTKDAMDLWADHTDPGDDHIPMERLYRFSLDSGLQKAQTHELNHLSLCPKCLDNWKILYEFDKGKTIDENTDIHSHLTCGFGTLQAAGSSQKGPLQLSSDCKKFVLSILPEESRPDEPLPQKAMIVIEVSIKKQKFHGRTVTVRDADANTVMVSTIRHGRAAAITDHFQQFDFSSWTIVLSGPAVVSSTPPSGKAG